EFVLPESWAKHHHRIATWDLIFVLPETAPQSRLHAQHAEVVTGNHHSPFDPRRGPRFCAEADRFHPRLRNPSLVAFRFFANVLVCGIRELSEASVVRRA